MSTNIKVLAAVYGTTKNGNNVTVACQNLVNPGNDDIPVNNTTLGPDPDPGATKYFGILYTNPAQNNGNPIALGAKEGQTLDLVPIPPTATTPPIIGLGPIGNTTVIAATYGSNRNGNNVTAVCQAMLNNGNRALPANNSVMGPDPDVGATKYFSILVTVAGKNYALACSENGTVAVPA